MAAAHDLQVDPNPKSHPDPEHPDPVVGPSKPRFLSVLGPGLITGASDDDPSGIATYSQAGAQFGYALGWTLVVSFPLMLAIQMIAARIGRVTGYGLARNVARHYPAWLVLTLVLLVTGANVINLGADLGAMGDSVGLVTGAPRWILVIGFGVLSILMEVFLQYSRYVSILKWITLAILSYVATLFMVKVPWGEALSGVVRPRLQWNFDYLTTVVAVLGTTISPYLFFWQASQEVEDIHAYPDREPLKRAPEQGKSALHRIELDTITGMAASNLVALAIVFTTAATLFVHHITQIDTSAQAAQALRPIAGPYAATIFALGVVGTGILAIPVLAGSAAYAIGESLGWKTGLGRKPMEARAFYGAIAIATLFGIAMNFAPIDPIRALYWSAVINGVTAAPIMVVMMLLVTRRGVMGEFVARGWLVWLGWAGAAAMAACAAGMVASWFI
ncbi:MAG TPA: divalent metal cation transporter [Beijerinckiaceae bacterium]|nr:divalent metal cation transporter [Beijerinckiaceae bacterium]